MATEERTDTLGIFKKFILICGIFLILLLACEILSGTLMQESNLSELDWTITVNGKAIDSAPGETLFKGLKRGDELVCSAVLPDRGFSYPAIIFELIRGKVTVTSGGKTLYTSEEAASADERMLINQIPLRTADFSQPVSIAIVADETNSIYAVPNFTLTELSEGLGSFIKARSFTFVVSLFLFFVGVIGTVICSASRFLSKKLLPLITISQFTFWASLCTFCHLGFIKVYIHNETVNAVLELASFYLSIICICLVIYPKLLTTKKQMRLFKTIVLAFAGYCLISLLLPLFTSLSVMDTFSVSFAPLAAALVLSAFMCVRQWLREPEKVTFPTAGFLLLCAFAVVEELRILLHAAGLAALGTPEMMILSFGILIFTACSLIDYFVWFKKSTIQETVEESWKRFSEPNSIPGISGYQKTLALLCELQDSKSQYTIITISIDNIEELNLSETPFPMLEDNFARLLHLVFSSYGITGNLGNGKFLAALPDTPEGKIKQLLQVFKELVKRDNKNHPDATIRFSYGYALSTDSDDEEIVKICQLANNSRKVQEQQLLN